VPKVCISRNRVTHRTLRLDEPLLQALSDKFVLFSYPPNSLMLAEGTTCNEVLILISGQVCCTFDFVCHDEQWRMHESVVQLLRSTPATSECWQNTPSPSDFCSCWPALLKPTHSICRCWCSRGLQGASQ